ncbi:MAG TPA: HAMP domain-containing sensor histidine kinase [Caulobacteraceae bacterium]|jgi:signal transduction histidine kinase
MLGGSTSFRLAALYTAGFSIAVAVLGLIAMLSTRGALIQEFDSRLRADQVPVIDGWNQSGLRGLLREMGEASAGPGALMYGVQAENGAPIQGPLANLRAPNGVSTVLGTIDGKPESLRVLTVDLGGRYRLLSGDKAGPIEALSRKVLGGFGLAFAGLLVIGIVAGFALSRAVQKRLDAISDAAEAIIDGDLGRRIPVRRGDDDLSRLAATINRMLDRIGGLMDSLRQVTSDVAHDLRTPLNRLRQRLERSARQAEDPAHRAEIEGALRDVDAILVTFAALLRISEVEAGARRAAFRPIDLQALVRTVAEDFAPAAEDTDHRLEFQPGPPAWIEGDAELLTQMTVNLVENALRHTPKGCTVRLSTSVEPGAASLVVVDNGPGVTEAERGRLFDRFYRLERSRSTPGSGLGLAMVQAVARLHRGEARLSDGMPGLKAKVVFPVTS